jgi:RES domain-containing protein
MITAWRIVKTKHCANAFDGEGARRYGGRWNSIGSAIVYTSDFLATAALELMVNMIDYSEMIQHYVRIKVEIPPEQILSMKPELLPEAWQQNPAPAVIQNIGDEWVANRPSAVLKAPSAVIPEHHSYLLNPNHKHFSGIKIHEPLPFSFDPRLMK